MDSLMRLGSRIDPRTKFSARIWLAPMVLTTCLLLAPSLASASPETLKRSISNISQAPLDFLLSPMTALVGISTKMTEQDDSMGVRIAFFVPGYIWYTGVNVGASVIRGVTGMIELIPGVLLLPFPEVDMDPLFDPVDNAGALVEIDTPCCLYIKFGIDYTAPVY